MKENTIEAEIVENEVVLREIKYPVSITDLDALLEEYKEIPEIDPDADEALVGEQYQFVLKGHKAFVKARNQIEKTRKELKTPALDYGKKVDEIAKEFQSKIKFTEDKLQIQRKLVEDNEARKQREAEEAEELRIDTIKGKILEIKSLPLNHFNSDSEALTKALESLRTITEAEYEEFTQEASEAQAITISQLQSARDTKTKAEQTDRLEAEREAEAKRLKDEQDAKLAKEREEFEAQQREFREKKEAFERQQREQQEVIDRQKAEIEAQELMKQQETERIEREKKEAFERQQREQQTKEHFEIAKAQLVDELKELKTITKIADAIVDGNITNLTWRY